MSFLGNQSKSTLKREREIQKCKSRTSPKIQKLNNNDETFTKDESFILDKEQINENELKTTQQIKLDQIVKNLILKTEGLRESIDQCSELANHLRSIPSARKLLESECTNFEIEFKEVDPPIPGNCMSEIRCLKSVLDMKAAIFFSGENDEEFERKCPTVEQFQLLENVFPVLDKIENISEKPISAISDLKNYLEKIQVSGETGWKLSAEFVLKELESNFS